MQTIELPVAEVKRRFSDAVSRAALGACRVVITRRSRPVAALVNMGDLRHLERREACAGLASAVGRWGGFEDIEPDVAAAVARRGQDAGGRDVPL